MEQPYIQTEDNRELAWTRAISGREPGNKLLPDFFKPIHDEMIRVLHPQNRDIVLDLATGNGELGLTIASMVKRGKIIVAGRTGELMRSIRDQALLRGIRNIRTRVCGFGDLPFADKGVDAISCGPGSLLLRDLQMAAKEMVRVLKPGGRIAVAFWNYPEKNFWLKTVSEAISRYADLPLMEGGKPAPLAEDIGFMTEIFRQAGLQQLAQTEVAGRTECRTPEDYRQLITEIGMLQLAGAGALHTGAKESIRQDLYQAFEPLYPGGNRVIESSAWIISGRKMRSGYLRHSLNTNA